MSVYVTPEELDRKLNDLKRQIPFWNALSGSIGIITFWPGALADIPDGWIICDGTNGTPDMRGKYPKGAPAGYGGGATGGSATHDHDNHDDHAALVHGGTAVAAHQGADAYGGYETPIKVFQDAGDLSHQVTQPNNHPAQSHSAHSAESNDPPHVEGVWIMWKPSV